MDAVLKALADGRRREILRVVGDGELAAGEIAERFEISRPAVSQHLAVLKAVGLLAERRAGTRRFYRVDPSAIDDVRSYLDEFWGSALVRLKAEVEFERRRRRLVQPLPVVPEDDLGLGSATKENDD